MEDAQISKMILEQKAPVLPEDIYYVSQAIGEAISGWGVGRYVIDAGTGAGKTTAIIDLLKRNVTSCPRFEVEGRQRILYLCNRKALWEQIVQAVLGDGVKRDFQFSVSKSFQRVIGIKVNQSIATFVVNLTLSNYFFIKAIYGFGNQ